MIVNAGGGNVSVPEPLLRLGDVGLMVKRVGGGRRPQRVCYQDKSRPEEEGVQSETGSIVPGSGMMIFSL